MAKAVIHVHQQRIRQGLPAIIVRTWRGSKHYSKVEVDGPVTIVHAAQPDSCGARVWIEADTKNIIAVA